LIKWAVPSAGYIAKEKRKMKERWWGKKKEGGKRVGEAGEELPSSVTGAATVASAIVS
jgi:hypothetical protein